MTSVIPAVLVALLFLVGAVSAQQGTIVASGVSSKKITITRDLTLAAGNVSYTGVGFMPTACVGGGAVTGLATVYTTFFGMAGSDKGAASVSSFSGNAFASNNFLVFDSGAATAFQTATIASYDVDGFTLTWAKTGAPSGTPTINVLCFR